MHQRMAIGDDFDARGDKGVDDLADRLLVARNGARGEDDGVARAQLRHRMSVLGHAGQRGARLALAAGGEREDLVARQAIECVHAEEGRHAVEHAEFPRHRDDALHRAAENADLPPGGDAGLGGGAQAGDVRGESGDDHPALRRGDQFGERRRDVALGRAFALAQHVGRVADQRQDAFVAERLQAGFVGRRADDGRRIDLPVAGMHDEAGRRADRQRRAFRNRVGDGHELDVEWADRDPRAGPDDLDRDLGRAGLAEPAHFGEPGRERRGVHLRAEARPQLRQRADVVFVGMGDDDADEVLLHLLDEADIRHDEVDAGQVVAGERDAEIDHQPLAPLRRPIAVERAIHPDFAEPSQRREHELVVVSHSRWAFPHAQTGRRRRGRVIRVRRYPEVGGLDRLGSALPAKQQSAVRVKSFEGARPDGRGRPRS